MLRLLQLDEKESFYHVERYLRESFIPRIAPVSRQLIGWRGRGGNEKGRPGMPVGLLGMVAVCMPLR